MEPRTLVVLFLRGAMDGLSAVAPVGDDDYRRRDELMNGVVREVRTRGRLAYVIPEGGSSALGSLGYALAVAELHDQIPESWRAGPLTLAYAAGLIESGQCSLVACVYATNQRTAQYRFAYATDPFGAPYGFLNPAGFAGLGFQRYLHKYGRLAERDKVGALAIAMRQYAAMNPIAFRREPMSWDDYLADRWIVWPLRRSDICLITDGAVCLLLADAELARDLGCTAREVTLVLSRLRQRVANHLYEEVAATVQGKDSVLEEWESVRRTLQAM